MAAGRPPLGVAARLGAVLRDAETAGEVARLRLPADQRQGEYRVGAGAPVLLDEEVAQGTVLRVDLADSGDQLEFEPVAAPAPEEALEAVEAGSST